ncbi:MAG: class I SAM-dependent methyltransferase, partial [Candidatus Marinimicrobia bacterium]|nr:class I SAM-dependent methyltransferase [Candidatus Neomarinimicrobiota bacterium]
MDSRFPCGHRMLAVLLWGLSFSLLAYEVVLLRILTYLQWYHFAYLVISLALLGFGASGTLLHLFRPFWRRHLGGALTGAFFLTGIALAANRPLLAVIPMDSFLAVLQPWQLVWLVLLGLVLFLPFFFGAFALILVFAAAPRRIALYYGANLLGSGAGALGGLLLLYRWHPLDIPPLLGLLTGLLGSVLVINAGLREGRPWVAVLPPSRLAWGLAGLGAIVLLGWGGMSRAQMSPYKALSRARLMPGIEVLLERSDPLGVLTIIRGPTLRSAAGLSFAYQGDIRPQPVAYLDGNPLGPLPLLDDPSATDALRHACFALPYRIRSFTASREAPQRVLVLNAGPGIDVQHALVEGAGSVTAVERHRGLIHALGRLADGEGGPPTVYHHPQVEVVVAEPRHFLYGDTTHYDVVVLPPMGGVISTSTGMEAVAENYLLTVEGMTAVVDRLSPGGLLCASVWLDTPLRRPLKLFGLMAAALEAHGPGNGGSPESHLAAIGSWNLMTVVLSRRPWSPAERERIIAFASREGFDRHFMSGVEQSSGARVFHRLADTTLAPTLAALAEGLGGRGSIRSPFHLDPPTDDRPFFNHLLTLRSLPVMRNTLGMEGFLLAEWGYVLVWVTLVLLG